MSRKPGFTDEQCVTAEALINTALENMQTVRGMVWEAYPLHTPTCKKAERAVDALLAMQVRMMTLTDEIRDEKTMWERAKHRSKKVA